MINLTKALERLQRWLQEQEIPFMILGGVANFIWGEPRLTQDIDVTIQVPEKKIEELVAKLSKVFKVLPVNPLDFVKSNRVLPLEIEGVRVDLILAGLEYEKVALKRALRVELGGVAVQVGTPEDLLIHKAISERERDWEDIEGILLKRSQTLDKSYILRWLEGFSQALEKDILKRFKNLWTELVEP